MDKKFILYPLYKNRFLILSCVMLIFGTFFGMSMLKFIPKEISVNLFGFISNSSSEFINIFLNRFSLPFIILTGIYFSGNSIFGSFAVPAIVFINGFLFGFENALNFKFSGMDYIILSLIIFFTSTVFIDFLLLIMSEVSVYSSRQIIKCLSDKNAEISHYNAKNITVKYISFTVIIAVISIISAAFYKFIQPIL